VRGKKRKSADGEQARKKGKKRKEKKSEDEKIRKEGKSKW